MSINQPGNQKPFSPSNILQSQGRPPIRSISQVYSHSRQTSSRQVSFDISLLRTPEPSAKRVKTDHEGSIHRPREQVARDFVGIEAQTVGTLSQLAREAAPYKLPPFPSRPGSQLQRTQSPVHQYHQNKEPVSSKPYLLDVPKIAPRYANKHPADFFPWTGDRPEDTLNESTIKNGYFDKSTAPQNESVSARPAIWSNMKHKSGLQSLSSLFVSTLQQRQKFGTAPSTSTFKPPPRATLTEPKRETWLKDLADADISLRRLSRTIPHGIRGKTLLDQCVSKSIPFERAIWLVKCVGANEIRAFKRKGPMANTFGSETKWISEWTMSVEEFINAVIESCGVEEWKENVNYSLQLVAHIYAEGLIDKTHFLEWVVSSLKAASVYKMPIWLLITQMFWNDISSCRRFGKKLAIALCEQANRLRGNGAEANQILWDGLATSIVKLLQTEPVCFLSPDQWQSFSGLLETVFHSDEEIFDQVRQRNEDLERFACMPSMVDSRQQVVDILDGQNVLFDIKKTSLDCVSACPKMDLLARTVCQWATTTYRHGSSNLFLCLRLLRRWTKSTLNLEPFVFSFIRASSDRWDLDKQKLFRLVCELVRSKHISVSRYLQWIMAQGTPLALERELLTAVPLHGLPDHARNLCQMVLDHPPSLESNLASIKATIRDRLFNDAMVDEEMDLGPIASLRLPELYQLAHWIRSLLFEYADDDDNQLASSDDLSLICRLLEVMKDYAVLADVLGLYAETGDIILLPIISDTVNIHFDCLHAIGAAENIYEVILERMEEIPNRSPAQKPIIQSLVDLAARLPRRSMTLLVLNRELTLCEPKSAIAACSPVSDTMGETQADITFFEEIEILFGSGSSMDRPLLTRIFTDIVKRLETSWTEDVFTSINLTEFLLRLRSFNRDIFSTLLNTWIAKILTRQGNVKTLFAILICGGLMDVQQLYVRLVTQATGAKDVPSALLLDFLDLLLETPTLPRSYHLCTQVNTMVYEDPKTLVQFLNSVLEITGDIVLTRPGVRELVLKLAIHQDSIQDLFPLFNPAVWADLALGLPNEPTFPQQLPTVLCYFNSRLCSGKTKKTLDEYSKTKLDGLSATILDCVVKRNDLDLTPWKEVIKNLPHRTLLELHQSTVTLILDSSASARVEAEDALLCLVGLVAQRLEATAIVSTITLLSDHLAQIQQSTPENYIDSGTTLDVMVHRLEVILRLLAIHEHAFSHAQIPAPTVFRICLGLCNLYLQPTTSSNETLCMFVLNTIISVSDSVLDEVREQVIASLNTNGITSRTLQFLFGPPSQNANESNLELAIVPAADVAHLRKDNSNPTTQSAAMCVLSPATMKNCSMTPFVLHRWEMVQDATPVIGENDTSLSLALFGARKAVL